MCPRVTRPLNAVTPAQASVAASSNDRPAGIDTMLCSFRTTYSDSTPSTAPPSDTSVALPVGRPLIQFGKKMGITLSPTLNRVTPEPTADTTPAPSDNGTSWPRGGIG